MLRLCCQRTLQIALDLKIKSVNCGACHTSWEEQKPLFWKGSDGTELEFGTDEIPKLNPDPCCLDAINRAVKARYAITYCKCGIKWARPTPRSDTWSAYRQEKEQAERDAAVG